LHLKGAKNPADTDSKARPALALGKKIPGSFSFLFFFFFFSFFSQQATDRASIRNYEERVIEEEISPRAGQRPGKISL
jgi:hypothetical protein